MAEVTLQDIAQRRAFLEGQRRNARANYEQAKAVVDAVDGAFQDLAFFEQLVGERTAPAIVAPEAEMDEVPDYPLPQDRTEEA